MTKILIIGAGRSSISLIDYMLQQAGIYDWEITVADMNLALAEEKTHGHSRAKAMAFDSKDEVLRRSLIQQHDLVISMLPAFMHGDVARDCVEFGKHMATASYVSDEMKQLDKEAKQKQVLLLNECGLDPGIDHASAMQMIHELQESGHTIRLFKSYCGGLVAPQSNDNPWGYKFSWNPRNVVLAGQTTAQYLEEGQLKFIPYNRLFTQTDTVKVEGYGAFDAYANRDSVGYSQIYGLESATTMLRGTLRQQGYCKAWNVFVRLGLTDDTAKLKNTNHLSYAQLIESFLPASNGSVKDRLRQLMGTDWDKDVENKLDYLGLFSDKKIDLSEGTPAQLLQALLEEKWKLREEDKDMIVMQHQFGYHKNGENGPLKMRYSSLVVTGKDSLHTAMALTVGLPLAITVKNFLTKKFNLSGVQIPVHPLVYRPMLDELAEQGIRFTESE